MPSPEAVIKAAENVKAVITVEEHSPFGGLGSMVAQVVSENCPRKVINIALPDAPAVLSAAYAFLPAGNRNKPLPFSILAEAYRFILASVWMCIIQDSSRFCQ